MIKKNNQTIGAVYKGTTEISKILKGTTLLYENWQTLTSQGISPLTLTKCKGENLLGYKVYGQSIQEANLVDNDKIIASSISSGKISIGLTGLTVQDSYATQAFLMSDLFEPNTTYYIHCERVYSTTRTNATGRISNYDGSLGTLLEYSNTDGKFTTGNTVTGYLYLYGFASVTVNFNNLYIGKLPYTQYEAHKVPSPTTPIEVQSVGDKTVNLLNYNQNFIVTDRNYNGNLTTIDTNIPQGELVTVSATVDATLAGDDANAVSLVLTYEDDSTYTYYYFNSGCIKIPRGTEGRSYTTVTATQNVKKVALTVHAFNLSEGGTTIFSNFQIAIGNVVAYEPYGKYKIPITTSGFNIWDEQWELGYWNSSGQKANADSSIRCKNKIPILEYTTYYIKCGNPNGLMVRFLDSNDTPLLSQYTTNTVITAPRNSISMVFFTNSADNVKTYNNDICINISNTTLNGTYQSYTAPTTTNIYLDAPLRKVGTVSDYIDFENSKVVRNINEIILDENSGWEVYPSSTYKGFNAANVLTEKYTRAYGLSNQSNYVGYYYQSQYPNAIWVGVNNKYVYWVFQDDYDDTLADYGLANLKARLAITPLVVDYVANTPTETTITLPSIPSIKGITVYIVGTDIQPSNMYVKYKGKN